MATLRLLCWVRPFGTVVMRYCHFCLPQIRIIYAILSFLILARLNLLCSIVCKVHSLYSEHLVQSHPNFHFLSVKLQVFATLYETTIAQNHPRLEKTKINFNQLKHKVFSVSPTHAREMWKRGTRYKGHFQLVQSTMNDYTQFLFSLSMDQTRAFAGTGELAHCNL